MKNKEFHTAVARRMIKRSVKIAGHRTSVSLEPAFWEELKSVALQKGISLNKLIEKTDRSRSGNLSSALRLLILSELKERIKTS